MSIRILVLDDGSELVVHLKMLDDILMNINHNTCVGGSETWRC